MTRDADSLEAALSRLFTAGASGRKSETSWFTLAGGEPLFVPGQDADNVYLVQSGRLGVFRIEEGQPPQFVGVIRSGQPAGEMSALSGTPHTSLVVALRDSEVVSLPRAAFLARLEKQPALMMELARLAILRAREKASAGTQPSVFGFVARRARPIAPFVRQIAQAIEAQGSSVAVIDAAGLRQPLEWFTAVEDEHDYVLYVAEARETAWAMQCVRQVDRLFAIADLADDPATASPLPVAPTGREHLVDLILARPADQRWPFGTGRWLDALAPARWFHVTERPGTDARRLARLLTATSVGLVLSGGGARAYAHVGAVQALRGAEVPFDFLGGASMGGIVAGGLALGWDDGEMDRRIRAAFVDSSPLDDIALPLLAMTHGRKVDQRLHEHFGEVLIEDLTTPFFCVATDLTAGRSVVQRRGLLREALRASIALPGVMPPVVRDGAVLVDGAVLKNFPADVMRATHAGPVVGVDVSRAHGVDVASIADPPAFWQWARSGGWRRGPPIVSVLMRSATLTSGADLALSRQTTDLLITPKLDGVEIRDWKAYEPAVIAGRVAAQAALAAIEGPVTALRQTESGKL